MDLVEFADTLFSVGKMVLWLFVIHLIFKGRYAEVSVLVLASLLLSAPALLAQIQQGRFIELSFVGLVVMFLLIGGYLLLLRTKKPLQV